MGALSLLSAWPGCRANERQGKGNCCSQLGVGSSHEAQCHVEAQLAGTSPRAHVGAAETPLEQLAWVSPTLVV